METVGTPDAVKGEPAAPPPGEAPAPKEGLVKRAAKGAVEIVKHPFDTLVSAARGVGDAASATVRTASELVKAYSPTATALGVGKLYDWEAAGIDHANDAIFGPRSTRGEQSFVEDTSNFLTGMWGAGKLTEAAKLGTVVNGLAKGAITDFAAFDPHQAQLAELAAQTNVPGMSQLGQLLSVSGDDSEIAARFKRSVGGLIPGVAIDGLIAGARFFKAKKVLVDPAASAEAKAAASEDLKSSASVLQGIDDGTHVPDQPVVVAQTPDGAAWELKIRQGLEDAGVSREDANAALGKSGVDPTPGTRWEKEAQAASINETLAEQTQATAKVTKSDIDELHGLLPKLQAAKDAGNAEEFLRLIREAQINTRHLAAPEEAKTLLAGVGKVWQSVFERARGKTNGGISWDQSLERARTMAGLVPREDMGDFLRNIANVVGNADALVPLIDKDMMDKLTLTQKWAQVMGERPDDLLAVAQFKQNLADLVDFSANVRSKTTSGMGRGLAMLKNEKPVGELVHAGEGAADAADNEVAKQIQQISGMTVAQAHAVAPLVRQTAKPQVIFNTMQAVLKPTGLSATKRLTGRLGETFYNFVLSHPAVHQAVFISNTVTNAYEDAVRLLAGTFTGNKALTQEAVDIMVGREVYLKQSLIGMKDAYLAGHSIIDPHPVVRFNNGVGGEIIRTLGSRPMAAMDEFWRVNSNLAYVRAKTLRLARQDALAQGLTGDAIDTYVNSRVKAAVDASIDPKTGASRLPEARDFASQPTFSSPLRPGEFGSNLEKMVRKHPFLLPVMPFMRTSVNVYRYSFLKNSPLGLLSKEVQESLARGGEEAAITGTRMAVGSAVWGLAGMLGLSGQITGNGPTDPQLRKMWLATNQPYSVKIGNEWVSYRRVDPFSTPLSVAADLGHMLRDHGSDPAIADGGAKVFYGLLASAISGFTSKTYLSGLIDFMNAIGSRDASAVKTFVDKMETLPIPSVMQAFNTDPYLRETQGLFDAFRQKIPGWGRGLPAKYNWAGEPVAVEPSRQERTLLAIPVNKAKPPMAEDELLRLQRALLPPPTVESFGKYSVNLHDRSYQNSKGGDMTPYERWMELVREHGLRDHINKIMASSAYDNAGDGTDAFPGGRRYSAVRDAYERTYQQTRRQMLSEYPTLKQDLMGLGKAKRAATRSDAKAQSILDRIGR
jgi:hypothetical protein